MGAAGRDRTPPERLATYSGWRGMSTRQRSRTVRLRDGARVRLRAIAREDKPLVAGVFDGLSEESRYRRFFTFGSELTPDMLAYLTEVDHINHEATIAIEPTTGRALGVARYIRLRDDPEAAEVAFAVVDEWQGRGLGRALLTHLTRRARQEGVRRFVALIKVGNEEAVGLLKGFNEIERRREGSEMELVIELPGKRGIGAQLAALLRAAAAGAVSGSQSAAERASPAASARSARPWRSITTIVVGSDGSSSASIAVEAATDLAAAFGATLHVVSAYPASDDHAEAERVLAAAEAKIREHGLNPVCHARNGKPAATLTEVANEYDADVIVVGSKDMSGVARIGGSVPNSVSHHAQCSVLIVRTL
jgi:nucleotide-binding universal stress UspA family protein/GNAT superfamily N-acetyltransferase